MTKLVFQETEIRTKIENLPNDLEVLSMNLKKRAVENRGLVEYYEVKFKCNWLGCGYEGITRHDHLIYDRNNGAKDPLGCPECSKRTSGFDKNKPAVLYAIQFKDWDPITFNKIGITNLTIEERFKGFPEYSIIAQENFDSGLDAYNQEQQILKRLKVRGMKYKPVNPLPNGNTECYIEQLETAGTLLL